MRQLPAPVRWAVTALAVAVSAGSVSGCMSVGDDATRPLPAESVDPSGAAAAEVGRDAAAPGIRHEPRTGHDADGKAEGEDEDGASAEPSASASASTSAPPGGGTPGARPSPPHGPPAGGGEGGGTSPSAAPSSDDPSTPPTDPSPSPTPPPDPTPSASDSSPSASPAADTRTQALGASERGGRRSEPAASPQVAPA
ncbi:hypothetical protein [Streptomyces sp. NPDC047928]|uniref:hypothetical protein n=1 Tax=unclassified Streptomyces TaxID=2593676 RepID=UPI00370FFF9F